MINEALKKAGVKKSEVTAYVVKDSAGVAGRYAPRTKALRQELELLFDDKEKDFVVDKVWVNGLKEVILDTRFNHERFF